MQIVYKIVKRAYHEGFGYDFRVTSKVKDGLLFSCRTRESDGGVIYRVGEWAAPRIVGSKLLAFGSLQNAQDFEDRYPEYPEVDQLYVAMAEGAAPIAYVNPSTRNHEAWWKHIGDPFMGCVPPPGTLACDRLYLVYCISSWHKVGCRCAACPRRIG